MKTYLLTAAIMLTIVAQTFLAAGDAQGEGDKKTPSDPKAMPDKKMPGDPKMMPDKKMPGDSKMMPDKKMPGGDSTMPGDKKILGDLHEKPLWFDDPNDPWTDDDLATLLEMAKDKGPLGDFARRRLKSALNDIDRTGLSAADGGVQDFVFLAESRPVLVRVHTHIHGKSLQAAWDEFMAHMFRYADIDKDGFLSDKELERFPGINQILSGGPDNFFGGYRMGNDSPSEFTVAKLDTDKDGKVSLAEFSAYFRKHGFTPFQVEAESRQDGDRLLYMAMMGKEPSVESVSDAMFALLDANKDGKITREELAAAPALLALLDTNEDDLLTPREVAPNARGNSGKNNMMGMMAGNSRGRYDRKPGNSNIILLQRGKAFGNSEPMDNNGPYGYADKAMVAEAKSGPVPAVKPTPAAPPVNILATRLQERYSPKGKQPPTVLGTAIDEGLRSMGLTKVETAAERAKSLLLSRRDIGLDEATFAALDTNGDGRLDAKELAAFGKRAPDIELVVRVGSRKPTEERVQIQVGTGKASPLAGKIKAQSGGILMDLGAARAEMRAKDAKSDRLAGLVRAQNSQSFKQRYDREGKGYIDEKGAERYGLSKAMFKAMDRDGDGKVTEQEYNAYIDDMAELQKRAKEACVTLVLTDESRGLFDLLDVDRDGKLSIRELRGAVQLLDSLDRAGKGYITRADVPTSHRLTVRLGFANSGNDNASQLALLYGLSDEDEQEGPTAGPAWFRKMDRNRDGDVSLKEWLGSEELFRRIDTDGDGLISLEEAERYDAALRLKK